MPEIFSTSPAQVSAGELCGSLAPFVPAPPEEQVRKEAQEYLKVGGVPRFRSIPVLPQWGPPWSLPALFSVTGLPFPP